MTMKVWVVDDDESIRWVLERALQAGGMAVQTFPGAVEVLDALEQARPDVVMTDIRMKGIDGLELLSRVHAVDPDMPVIVMTAHSDLDAAVAAYQGGAFEYLPKPFDVDEAVELVQRAQLSRGHGAAAAPEPITSAQIVGEAPAMQEVFRAIGRLAKSQITVLITGESGTGKELVARAVHDCSHRSAGPFVAVNCGAIPENLIEAEFFGARKGAYTGATADREGYFQAARGGTLFLDEIGDLPLAMQAKLLRVIQERRVRALGGVQEEAVDVRLVSATHRDLTALVQAGNFRQDLFYRLNVIALRTPALRERRDDLPSLVQALLARLCAESGQGVPDVSPRALAWLQSRELPGNVRELENLLQRALALSSGDALEPEDFGEVDSDDEVPTQPDELPGGDAPAASMSGPPAEIPADLQTYLDEQERQVLLKALRESDFNRTAAAARLGLNLRQMRYRIQRLGLNMPSDDNDGA